MFFIPVVALIIKCQFKPTLAARATPDNTVKCYLLKKDYVIVASINLIINVILLMLSSFTSILLGYGWGGF